jgi:hypothetical protein
MKQKIFLVHGWSVQETTTYQAIHLKLAEYGFHVQDIFLGRYVSLENSVEIRDISKAMHYAIDAKLNGRWDQPFHVITHSTGALVTKHWIVHHYREVYAEHRALENVIFLAAPHFGSRLAHHGRSMIAQGLYLGDTGKRVLEALELGSEFLWDVNEWWLDERNWKQKGIRPFNLTGDRANKDIFKSKIFPAGYEEGSDMVVRVASANLNFKRFVLEGKTLSFRETGRIEGVPFGALAAYTHSEEQHGIMNSITRNSTRENHQALRLIIDCLRVSNDQEYAAMYQTLGQITAATRRIRPGFAQLDFRFRDEQGRPVDDYVFKLGAIVDGKELPSETVIHTHKNEITPSHFTVFIDLSKLEPHLSYFIDLNSESGSPLFNFYPDPLRMIAPETAITDIIIRDQTTQIDVILSREPSGNLFTFHRGDDPDLHVKWNRKGVITAINLGIK